MGRDQRVEPRHRDRATLAAGLAHADSGGTGIIAMHLAAFRRSSAKGHRAAAGRAVRQTGLQDRTGHDARRRHARIAGG